MAITVKHTKVSTIPDGDDTSVVRPSDWNAEHQLVGTVPVANGGTGAATLTGYVKGNGTSTMTASSTIPNTDITGLGTASTKDAGVANGVATLDGSGTVPISQLPAAVLGALSYQGTWNATTNTPTLTSSVGTKGYYYVVSVAGSTNLNGVTDWQVGDWAVYNGTAWQKIDNTDSVTSVNGYTGTVVLTQTDISGTVPTSRTITAGTGLTGGGDLSANRTLAIATTGVSATTYGSASIVPVIAVNTQGQITSATNTTIAIANTQVSGLGTMSTQNSSNVTITGGSLNGVAIGGSSAGDGTFDILTANVSRLGIATGTSMVASNGLSSTSTFSGTPPTDGIVVDYSTGYGRFSAFTGDGYQWYTGGVGTTKIMDITSAGALTTTGNVTANGVLLTGNLGTVTSVTGTSPVVSSGGNTPAISMPAATTSVNGYLTSADWTTFNGKGSGTVTSVGLSAPTFLSVTGSPVTGSGTLALSYSGTALPVLNGGTGTTTSTGTGSVVLGTRPTMSVTGTGFTLQDATDNTKQANFSLANIATGTTRTYTLPNLNGTLATLGTQTFTGVETFTGTINALGTIALDGDGTHDITLGGNATTAKIIIGGTTETGAITVGQSTSSQTVNLSSAATASGNTNTINIGTGGLTGSTTAINIGSTTGTSTTTINGTFSPSSLNVTNNVTIGGTLGITGATTATGGLTANNLTTQDGTSGFTIKNATDATKIAKFDVSNIPTANTYTYILPPIDQQLLATTGNYSQSFSGATTFVPATNSSTFAVGGPLTTGAISIGRATVAQTVNIATGVNTSATKTVNIGTNGTGGTTAITIGSSSGSTSTTVVNGTFQTPNPQATNGIVVNSNTVSASYTIPSGSSAMSAGPMTVATGQSVTVSSGSRWVVL